MIVPCVFWLSGFAPSPAPNLNSLCAPFSQCFLVSWAQSCVLSESGTQPIYVVIVLNLFHKQLFNGYQVVNRSCNVSVQFSMQQKPSLSVAAALMVRCNLVLRKKSVALGKENNMLHDIWPKFMLNVRIEYSKTSSHMGFHNPFVGVSQNSWGIESLG